MAVYFDSIVPDKKVSAALDPNTELFTWLSYKFRDWAQKCGPNYVYMISDHTNWRSSELPSALMP